MSSYAQALSELKRLEQGILSDSPQANPADPTYEDSVEGWTRALVDLKAGLLHARAWAAAARQAAVSAAEEAQQVLDGASVFLQRAVQDRLDYHNTYWAKAQRHVFCAETAVAAAGKFLELARRREDAPSCRATGAEE